MANKPDGYLLGSYCIATAPELNSSRLTSFKSIRVESPANNVGPWPASLGCTTNSYSSINPSSANASGSVTPPTKSPLPDSRFSCCTALPRSPRSSSAFQSTRSRVLDTTHFCAASIVRAKGSIQSDHRAIPADEDLHRHVVENLQQADALLFGRVTYEMMEAAFRPPAPTGARPWLEGSPCAYTRRPNGFQSTFDQEGRRIVTTNSVAQKAHVKPGATVAVLNPVAGIVDSLGLPQDVTFVSPGKAQLVFLFVGSIAELESRMPKAVDRLSPTAALWVFFKKGSKTAKLSMNRNDVWAMAESLGLRPLGLVSVDETWSAFRFKQG